jgi:cobyrinic acid a,c-diamide synthase
MGAKGLIVAAASSHSGKTTIALGLIAALRGRELKVAAAKCGPDYIDPRFLEAASGAPAVNLDTWAMAPEAILSRLARVSERADIVVIEGVMGLYDGGAGGAGSTASLAKITGLPVLLVVGTEGTAQSAAAVAEGFFRKADGFNVVGAIANNIASERHSDLVREGFVRTSVPLLGLVRRDASIAIASRHLGLVQAEEHADLKKKIARAGELVAEGCDVERIVDAAERAPPPPCGEGVAAKRLGEGSLDAGLSYPSPQGGGGLAPLGRRIAVARDVAFAFAYPHLLQDWRDRGASISFFSPLVDEAPASDADAIYLPGGYPELYAARIAAAQKFRAGMHDAAKRGTLVYGECGGYMALGESLVDADGVDHPMLGLLPLQTSFRHRMLNLGYRVLRPLSDLPWDTPLAAHEFHFARIVSEGDADPLFEVEDASGAPLGPAGLRRGNVMGSFVHVIDAKGGAA